MLLFTRDIFSAIYYANAVTLSLRSLVLLTFLSKLERFFETLEKSRNPIWRIRDGDRAD